jgi:hypothetical protein
MVHSWPDARARCLGLRGGIVPEKLAEAKKWAEEAREIVLNMQLNDHQLEATSILAAMAAMANAIIALAVSKQ